MRPITFIRYCLFLLSFFFLYSGYISAPRIKQTVMFKPSALGLTGIADESALPEARSVILDYPKYIRVGDVDQIKLTFVAQTSSDPVADIFKTHTVLAQARMELRGAGLYPNGEISEAVGAGKNLSFVWSLRMDQKSADGNLWFSMRFLGRDSDEDVERALVALPIKIERRSLLGLSGENIRLLGYLFLFFGLLFSIPLLGDWLLHSRRI